MPFLIKSLGAATLTSPGTADMYLVPAAKSAMVTSIRVVNGSAANSATINLLVRPSGAATSRRIAKQNVVAVGGMVVMEDVVTPGEGDKVQVDVSGTSPTVSYTVNGTQRD